MHREQKSLLLLAVGVVSLISQILASPLPLQVIQLECRSSISLKPSEPDHAHWVRSSDVEQLEFRSCSNSPTGCVEDPINGKKRRSQPTPTVAFETRDNAAGCANSPTGCGSQPHRGGVQKRNEPVVAMEERDDPNGCANSPTGCKNKPHVGRKRFTSPPTDAGSRADSGDLVGGLRRATLPPDTRDGSRRRFEGLLTKDSEPSDCHNSPTGCHKGSTGRKRAFHLATLLEDDVSLQQKRSSEAGALTALDHGAFDDATKQMEKKRASDQPIASGEELELRSGELTPVGTSLRERSSEAMLSPGKRDDHEDPNSAYPWRQNRS